MFVNLGRKTCLPYSSGQQNRDKPEKNTFGDISKVDVYDYNTTGDHDFIGEFSTTLEEMGDGEGFQIVTW